MPPKRDIPAARYRAAVGVDETRREERRSGCPPLAPASGECGGWIIEFLRGDWDVERLITDRRSGQDGAFRGTAWFRPTADSDVLEYTEDGELQFGSHHGPARRSLIYRGRADGAADVRFADGREFYRLDLRAGAWQADHPCRADSYHVTITRLSPDSFTEVWRVAGPDKDYELDTTYRRITHRPVAEAISAIDPAGCGATVTSSPDRPR